MAKLGMTPQQYGLLTVKERAMYIIRDHLTEWFQALSDNSKLRQLEAKSKNANRV